MPRPKRITLSPSASDPDGIALTQTLVDPELMSILNGTLSSGYDLDAVCLAQTTADAAALLLNGTLGGAPHRVRGTVERLVFTSASDNSGIVYAIVGTNKRGDIIGEDLTGTVASQKIITANAYWSITSITTDGAVTGNVTVGVNGVATFTTPQHVSITATSDESLSTFTVTGTDRWGVAQTESITGPNNTTVVGVMNFATVSYVANDLAATGVTVGVDGTCESAWYPLSLHGGDFNVGMGVSFNAAGAMTYSVQHTFDDVYATGFVESTAEVHDHDSLVDQTTEGDGNYTNPLVAVRLEVTAHTAGAATLTIVQAGR